MSNNVFGLKWLVRDVYSFGLHAHTYCHILNVFFSTRRRRHRVFGYPFCAVVLFISLQFLRTSFQFENNFIHEKLSHYTHFMSTNLKRFVSFWLLSLLSENVENFSDVKQVSTTFSDLVATRKRAHFDKHLTIGRIAIKSHANIIAFGIK